MGTLLFILGMIGLSNFASNVVSSFCMIPIVLGLATMIYYPNRSQIHSLIGIILLMVAAVLLDPVGTSFVGWVIGIIGVFALSDD